MAFFKGAVWGVVIGGAGAVTASLIAPQPVGTVPPATPQVTAPQVAAIDAEADRATGAARGASDDPAPVAVTTTPMTLPEQTVGGPVADSTLPDLPAAGQQTAMPDVPPAGSAPGRMPGDEAPVLPNPQSRAPALPVGEADIVVQTTPAAPVTVTTPEAEDTAAAQPQVVILPEDEAGAVPPVVEVVPDAAAPAAPVAPVAEVAPDAAGLTEPEAGEMDAPQGETDQGRATDSDAGGTGLVITTPDAPAGPLEDEPEMALSDAAGPERADAAGAAGQGTGTDDGAEMDAATESAATANGGENTIGTDSTDGDAPTAVPDRPAVVAIIDTPSAGLPGGDTGVVVRRPAADADDVADGVVVDPPADTVAEADAPLDALRSFGAFFDNPEGLPLMSVMLLDDGSLADGPRALADVPFAVTVVLDPADPDAADRMAAYAEAGIEVAALAALPDGGTATDVEVALEATFAALPRAVALVDAGATALAGSGDAVDQVVGRLQATGRGLVVPEAGLNSAVQQAAEADVPALTIYRDLDNIDQDARVIRRFIDQAAFQARQQPGVILLGRVRPETISALILWGSANRAGQVAVAPLSATLLAQ